MVTFTATDDCGNTSTTSATFTIEDTTDPTIDVAASDLTVECDGAGNTADLNAWLASIGDTGAASDACGGVVWTNDFDALSDLCGATGSALVTFTATDDCGNTSTTSATFTIEDTIAPSIDTVAEDQTVECGPAAQDAFDAWLALNGGAMASDDCSAVTWTNDFTALSDLCGETGAATVIFTATDECGNSASTTATFTIEDTIAPVITCPPLTVVECGDDTSVASTGMATASDICGDVTITYSDVTSTTPACDTETITRTWTATDECGNEISCDQIILVASVDIVKTFDDDSVIAGGAGSSFTLTVTNDGTAPLSNVLIADTVDDRLTVTSVTGTAGADNDSDGNDQTVEWLIASLAPNASATITVDFTVDSAVEEANGVGDLNDDDNVPNSATVNAVATDDPDVAVDDDDNDSIDILVDIDLSIVKTFDPTEVPQGTLQSFTIVVTNNGPSDAFGDSAVSVTDLVDSSLEVTAVTVTSGDGNCAAPGQNIDCTLLIPAGSSATITVDYITAPFLDSESPYPTTAGGDDFYIVFVNGSILEGTTRGAGLVLLDGVDITASVSIITSLTRNDLIFDPPGPDPAFEMHLSCSDPFTGGWGQSAGPVEGVDVNWQIAFFTIARFNNNGYLKSCGNVVNPFDVPNTAFASGEDTFGTQDVSDDATVTVGPGITIDRLQTNGKRLTVRLNNLTGDDKAIDEITAVWPDSNGDLRKVWLTYDRTSNVIWQGIDDAPDALLNNSVQGWLGGTLLTGEAILRFDFKNKVASSGYVIRVLFMDGTWLDISVDGDESARASESTVKETTVATDSEITDFSTTSVEAYPLPFNEVLYLGVDIEYDANLLIEIFDYNGRLILRFNDYKVLAGYNTIELLMEKRLPTELYMLRVSTGQEVITKTIMAKQ